MVGAQQVAISLHNDWSDRDLDGATKPWRALPSGVVPAGAVRAGAWALAVLSLAFGRAWGGRLVLLDAIGAGAGFLYNARLKRTSWSWLPFAVAFPSCPCSAPPRSTPGPGAGGRYSPSARPRCWRCTSRTPSRTWKATPAPGPAAWPVSWGGRAAGSVSPPSASRRCRDRPGRSPVVTARRLGGATPRCC